MNNIKSGDLLVWANSSPSLFDKLCVSIVQIFTQSKYAHVGIAWHTSGKLFVIEACQPRVRIRPIANNENFYHVPVNLEWFDKYDQYLFDQIGEPYSIFDAIRGYFGLLRGNDDNKWQCAELVHNFYKNAGIDLGNAYTPAKIVDAFNKEPMHISMFKS